MAKFNVPSQPARNNLTVERFRGVDMTSSPSGIDKTRAAAAPNMIRDEVGSVRKRMGYSKIYSQPQGGSGYDYTYGVHHLGSTTLVHQGQTLYYVYGSLEYNSGEAIQLIAKGTIGYGVSRSFVFKNKLYLLTDLGYFVYDNTTETLRKVSDVAYVPTVIISRRPTGGGTVLEGYNLIGKKWKESFLGTASDTVYQLTQKGLDTDAVLVSILQGDGTWANKTEGTDFTVDRVNGTVTFTAAPGESPVTGKDNVEITATKTNSANSDMIENCHEYALYGVGGSPDRVFLGGNAYKPGVDWYSGFDDPTYFPDTNYTNLSRDGATVLGYVVLNDMLVTFMGDSTDGRNAVIRKGTLKSDGEAVFAVTNALQGPQLTISDTICKTEREPLYATVNGVYTIAAEELTGERYNQERGYYIRGSLSKYPTCACMYGDFYALVDTRGLYLLDTRQRSAEKNTPYSTFQYECYFWPITHVTRVWMEGEKLLFAKGSDGGIYRFYTAVASPQSYNDDGEAIDAYWETSDMDGDLFYHAKTFCGVAVRLAAGIVTGVKIYAQSRGVWKLVYDSKAKARYLDWSYIDFEKFTFSTDRTPRTLYGKIKIKRADKARFRLQNAELNEPFGLYAFGLQYKEPGGNYKR